jgi:hypothetical protein
VKNFERHGANKEVKLFGAVFVNEIDSFSLQANPYRFRGRKDLTNRATSSRQKNMLGETLQNKCSNGPIIAIHDRQHANVALTH